MAARKPGYAAYPTLCRDRRASIQFSHQCASTNAEIGEITDPTDTLLTFCMENATKRRKRLKVLAYPKQY